MKIQKPSIRKIKKILSENSRKNNGQLRSGCRILRNGNIGVSSKSIRKMMRAFETIDFVFSIYRRDQQ